MRKVKSKKLTAEEEAEEMLREKILVNAMFDAYYESLPPGERKKALHEIPDHGPRERKCQK